MRFLTFGFACCLMMVFEDGLVCCVFLKVVDNNSASKPNSEVQVPKPEVESAKYRDGFCGLRVCTEVVTMF